MNLQIKLITMAILWSGAFIVSKVAILHAGPWMISFLRFFMTTLIMYVFVCRDKNLWKLDKHLIINSLGGGIIGVFFYNYFFYSGIGIIDAGRGSVILSMVPAVVVVLSIVLLKEKISFIRGLGVAVSIFGASVTITKGKPVNLFNDALGGGEVYLGLCVLCAALFTMFSKQLLNKMKPVFVMFYISLVGTGFLMIPAFYEALHIPVDFLNADFILSLLYLSIGPSVIAVIFYYEAMAKVGPSKATQYMNLIPVFAVVLAFVFLGEQLSYSLLVGGGLVTTGLFLTNIQ